MAISYEEALATLQSMFSDQGYTAQQLDGVLRHHGGHMEHTVETLLSHGEGTPGELMQKLPSIPAGGGASAGGGGGNAHNVDADEELARQLAAEDERQQQRRGGAADRGASANQARGMTGLASALGASGSRRWNVPPPPGQQRRAPVASTVTDPSRNSPGGPVAAPRPPAGTKGRGTPTVLPADFLRIPGRKYSNASEATSNGASDQTASAAGPGGQMMTDEQMARMLQDELFQEELRNNPEFSHLAGRRDPRSASSVGARPTSQNTGRSTYSGAGGGVGWGERTDFFDRLSELGDNAKRRFQDLAANWNDPNARLNRQSRTLFGAGGGSQSHPPLAGNERRGLLSDDLNMDEEEEMDFVGGGGEGGRDFEMNDVRNVDKKKD